MNCCRETAKMGVPPGNHRVLVSVPERYVAGSACPERSRRNTRGRQEGRPYPWSQQVIKEISGLVVGEIKNGKFVQAGQHLFLRGNLLLLFSHHLLSLPAANINFFIRLFHPRSLNESLGHSIGLIIRVLPRRVLHKIG